MKSPTASYLRNILPALALIPAIVLLCAPSLAIAQEIDAPLTALFVEGDETRYDISTESTTKQVGVMFPGGAMTQSVEVDARVLCRAVEVGAERAIIEVTYERLRVAFDAPDLGISPVFDSEAPEADGDGVLRDTLGPIVGAPIMVEVASASHDTFEIGEIMVVTRPESVTTEGEFGRLAAAIVSPQAVRANLQSLFSTYSGEAIRQVGSRWRRDLGKEFVTDGGVALRFQVDYLVRAMDDQRATIGIDGKIDLGPRPEGPFKRVEMNESSVLGESAWNHVEGKLESSEVTSSMKLMFNQGPGGALRLESTTHEQIQRVR